MKKILPGIIFLVVVFAVVGAAVYFSKKTGDFEEEETESIIIQKAKEDGEEQDFVKKEVEGSEEKKTEEQKNEDGLKKEGDIEVLSETNWQWVDNQEKLYNLTSAEINLVLGELQERFPDSSERLKVISVLRLGTPYQMGCLGEELGRDADPIFRVDVTDCTAFVLTNAALLYSRTLGGAKEMMRFVNYQPHSEISFENRLHFTTDRNAVSPYFEDITEKIGGEKTETKTVILNKKRVNGTRLIDIDWQKETVLKYIPNKYLTRELFQNLPQAVGVAFIKEGDEKIGLDVRHEGFLFDSELFFHASSVEKKVVVEDFFDYYFGKDKNLRFDGIILFVIK